MNCRMCSVPLKPTQGRYCSKPCQYRGQIVPRRRRCRMCPQMLTGRQISRDQRYCSVFCARAAHVETTPMQDALLAILRTNRDWFLTSSDLAIWLYGYDDQAEDRAIRTLFYTLRKRGYRFETRVPTWLNVHGATRAYRLMHEPTMATRRVA